MGGGKNKKVLENMGNTQTHYDSDLAVDPLPGSSRLPCVAPASPSCDFASEDVQGEVTGGKVV